MTLLYFALIRLGVVIPDRFMPLTYANHFGGFVDKAIIGHIHVIVEDTVKYPCKYVKVAFKNHKKQSANYVHATHGIIRNYMELCDAMLNIETYIVWETWYNGSK